MNGAIVKALRIARDRPTKLWDLARQYILFRRTWMLQRWIFTPSNGIDLGVNARIQRLSCLSAERPNARVAIGADCIVYENARIEAYGNGRIAVGDGSIIGDARIYARGAVRLGQRVITSWNVFIQDFDPHPINPELRAIQMQRMIQGFKPTYRKMPAPPALAWDFKSDPITIGDDVWLGANVTVLKGAHIGEGSVVATGSVVVAGQYPARSILAGSPARVVKLLQSQAEPVS